MNPTLSALKTARKWLQQALETHLEDFDDPPLKRALAKVEKAIKTFKEPVLPHVIVTIEGGNYQGYSASGPVRLYVLDYDNMEDLQSQVERGVKLDEHWQKELDSYVEMERVKDQMPVQG